MKHDLAHITRLQKELEQQLGWGPVSQWHSSMFEELSEEIFQATKVKLSSATLKRFCGVVAYKGSPSITTLDALSGFVGKENWRVFKLNTPHSRIKPKLPRRSIYVVFGFFLAVVMFMLISNKRPDIIIQADEVSFSSRPVGTEYPNSVIFDFSLPKLRTNNLYIQQYWDDTKTINITQDQTQATGIYYFPGYFRAKLMVEENSVKEHDLFLKSDGWLGTIEYEPVPKYFQPIIDTVGHLSYPLELEEEIKASKDPLVSVYHYIDDLGNISGDSFSFSANVQHTYYEKWAVCQALQIYFIGTTGAMIIPFSKIGCVSDNNLMLNDVFLSGKKNDLSALSTDFTTSKHLNITVKDKDVSIFIEGKKVYSLPYQYPMGNLVGVRFKYLGLGIVKNIRLQNQYDREIVLQ